MDAEKFALWAVIVTGCLLSSLFVAFLASKLIDSVADDSSQRDCRRSGGVVLKSDEHRGEWRCAAALEKSP